MLEHTVCSAPNPSKDTQRQGKGEATYPFSWSIPLEKGAIQPVKQ